MMKISGLEPAYEAARTWALHPVSHPPSGWAQILRGGIALWMRERHPPMRIPLASTCSSQRFSTAHDRSSYDYGGMSMISGKPSAVQKITARHLPRKVMLYVRQSPLHQVRKNTKSPARQYGLRERAIALGWEASHIIVIDQDLGQ